MAILSGHRWAFTRISLGNVSCSRSRVWAETLMCSPGESLRAPEIEWRECSQEPQGCQGIWIGMTRTCDALRRRGRPSHGGLAGGDGDELPRDVAGEVAAEEDGQRRDVLRRRHALE